MSVIFSCNTTFLVTGGAGFIGSNLVEALLKLNVHVRVLDNYSTGKKENLEAFKDNPSLEIIEGDIRDIDVCQKSCQNIDFVFHHAALGSVPRSIEDPLTTNTVNVDGTLNMLIAARDNAVKRFIYASSSSVYGDEPTLPKKEGKEGNLLSPYAVSKSVNELYAKNFYTVYGLPTIGLRYFNVFGKHQDPYSIYAAVIPVFIEKLLKNEAPTIFGDGLQSRDFTHVDNVIEANLKACIASKESFGDSFNIAFGDQLFLNDLYNAISNLLEKNIPPFYRGDRKGDIKHSNADIQKSKELLNYIPQTNWKDGLQKSITWYKENL
ncbi:MAG: UDP-N-acetylglucosamine 4-epimerase [Holosporales bacterium]